MCGLLTASIYIRPKNASLRIELGASCDCKTFSQPGPYTHKISRSFLCRAGSVCLDVINQTWSPLFGVLSFSYILNMPYGLELLQFTGTVC